MNMHSRPPDASPRSRGLDGLKLNRSHAGLAAMFIVSAAMVFLSHAFTRDMGRIASIWPLNAFVLAILLGQPEVRWRALLCFAFAGNLAVNAAFGDSVPVAIALTLANVIEVLICAKLLVRRDRRFDMTRGRDLLRFAVVASVLAPAVSALVAAATLAPNSAFFASFANWFAADALGMLVFGPAFFVLAAPSAFVARNRPSAGAIALGGGVLLLALVTVFSQSTFPLLFLVPPALTLATFQLGITGAAAGILLTAVVSILFTIGGHGPTQLVNGPPGERILVLEGFLAIMSLTTLPIAAAVAQGKRSMAALAAAQARAEASETHYRTLADHATDIVVRSGRGGIITYVSPSCSVLGVTAEQATGRSTLDFAEPEDRPYAEARLALLFSRDYQGDERALPVRARRADGTIMWLEGNPTVIRDAAGEPVEIVNTFRDVTARLELEEQLSSALTVAEEAAAAARDSETRYRTMADISLDVIARMGMDGTMRFVSPSSEIVLGYTPEELVGTKTLAHTHPDDVDSVIAFFIALIAKGPGAPPRPYRYRARRKDGAYIWLEGVPRLLFDANGKPCEIQDSARDVTQRTELERELSEARLAAESAARAKADFLANMSHELRTPLNSILGFSSLLAGSAALSPQDSRHVDLIATSSLGLLAVVNDILDFSSLESGVIRLEALPFSVESLVRRCMEGLAVQADAKNLALSVAIDGDLAATHVGDRNRLNQILINLVGNAIKFTAKGEVAIGVRAMATSAGHQTLRFDIRDTGIGIPEDQRDSLFQRFSQVDSSINRRFGGTGLGLAITRSLVDLMGGAIDIESREGEGSTFRVTITLPVAAEGVGEALAPRGDIAPMAPQRILLVDDVDLNRELGAALLAGSGHAVDVAGDGAEALARVRRGRYDLVFMDVQMPGMDGLAATRAIRALTGFAELPIVAMTAQAMPDQIAACLAAGMNDHLAKPVTPDGLHAMIGKWCGQVAPETPEHVPVDVMQELRARFVARSRTDLTRLRDLIHRGEDEEIRDLVHRFAGAAGTFGFADAGAAAVALDQRYASGDLPDGADLDAFAGTIEGMLRAA